MSRGRSIGECSLCRQNVYGVAGVSERINHGGKRVEHRHKKPYEILQEPEYNDEYRYWHDQVPGWAY